MAKAKYQQFYEIMRQRHPQVFEEFQPVHDAYLDDPEAHADEFHQVGSRALDVIRDWERRLCSGMERGTYAAYSARLAEKFWDVVRKDFPKIDEVGVKIRQVSPQSE